MKMTKVKYNAHTKGERQGSFPVHLTLDKEGENNKNKIYLEHDMMITKSDAHPPSVKNKGPESNYD
jgi:hypothetical protein